MFGVPPQTLRDRFTGMVDPDSDRSSNALLSREEEGILVEHVEVMAQLGYGYTHIQLQHLAGELAHSLERRQTSKPLSNNWLYGFLQRWKDRLSSLNPRSLETTRAKAATPEVVNKYYKELDSTLEKYGLKDKPQCIYNLDETGLQPDHRPPNVIAPSGSNTQSITSPRSTTVTLVGCANAAGNSLPPFFIFKGKRYMPELLTGATIGVKATMSDSGWINGAIFKEYLTDHFLPFVRPGNASSSQHILLMYDGHKSHISPDVIQWAKSNKIILFVLPPHTSHLLQPLDVAIYAPFKHYYHSECSLFMRKNIGEGITRYNMCELACKAYLKAMSPSNIQAAFRKTGIHPFSKQTISPDKLFPTEAFREKEPVKKVMAMKGGKDEVKKFLELKIERMSADKCCDCGKTNEKNDNATIKRPSPGGLAITEGEYENRMTDYENARELQSKKQRKDKEPKKPSKCQEQKNDNTKPNSKNMGKSGNKESSTIPTITYSPKPSTSGINILQAEDSGDSEIEEEEKCCVCRCFSPPAAKGRPYLVIVKWAQCDKCDHWVHLEFCSTKKFVRRHGAFLCCHCE